MNAATAARFARVLALAGFVILIVVLLAWHGWLARPRILPLPLVLGVLLLPLAAAAPGLYRGRSYTHAWVSLLSLAYFILAVDGIAAGVEPRWLAPAALSASIALFTGSVVYVRACGVLRRRAGDDAQD